MPVAAAIGKAVGGKLLGKVVGGVLQKKAGKSDNRQADADIAAQRKSSAELTKVADKMGARGDDRWNFYQEHGQAVDVALIDDALRLFEETFTGGSERAAARAAEDVATAFDRSSEVRRRAELRFSDPSSGRFASTERISSIERAKAEAGARFSARRTEEDRARSVLTNASKVGQRAINDSQQFSRLDIFAKDAGARILTGTAADARSEASGSAALVGDIADAIPFDDLFAGGSASAVSGSEPTAPQSSSAPNSLIADTFKKKPEGKKDGGVIRGYRYGGAIRANGKNGGVIKGPGSGRSDSVRAVVDGHKRVNLSNGEFIIPAKVVARKGEGFFQRMIRGQ
jgi:hypothetical protein